MVPLTLESKNWCHDRPKPCRRRSTRKFMGHRGYPQFFDSRVGATPPPPFFLPKMSTFRRRLTPASPTSPSIIKTFTNQFIININRGFKMVTDQFINVILKDDQGKCPPANPEKSPPLHPPKKSISPKIAPYYRALF